MDSEAELIDRIRKANLDKANTRRNTMNSKKAGGVASARLTESLATEDVPLPTVPDLRREKKQQAEQKVAEVDARVAHKAEKQAKREEEARMRMELAEENKILRKQIKHEKRDADQQELMDRLQKVEGAQINRSLIQSTRYGGAHGRQMVYHRACDLVAKNARN